MCVYDYIVSVCDVLRLAGRTLVLYVQFSHGVVTSFQQKTGGVVYQTNSTIIDYCDPRNPTLVTSSPGGIFLMYKSPDSWELRHINPSVAMGCHT